MTRIRVREVRSGDGMALARIHADMGGYYADPAPQHFQRPLLEGLAAAFDADCQRPSGSPQWRPPDLPAGGHDFSPLVAIGSPRRAVDAELRP
jgi:hypothetical protein